MPEGENRSSCLVSKKKILQYFTCVYDMYVCVCVEVTIDDRFKCGKTGRQRVRMSLLLQDGTNRNYSVHLDLRLQVEIVEFTVF